MAPLARLLAGTAAVAALAVAAAGSSSGPAEVPLRTHSLRPPFLEENLENRYWDFGGSTVVSTNKYIRLTPDRQSKTGWLWSKTPIEYDNWSVEFEFRVDGQGTRVFGDGFAFWMTEERAEPGPAFGNKADFHGLGIFFDTYMNGRHSVSWPQVIAQVNDGTRPYNVADDNMSNRFGGCDAKFRKTGSVSRARVTYLARALSLELDLTGNANWVQCFRVDDYVFPYKKVYIGFTAATGDVADEHDILSVTTSMINLNENPMDRMARQMRQPLEKAQETLRQARTAGRDRVPPLRTTTDSIAAVIWIIVIVGVIVSVIALFVFSRMQQSRNKRF